MSGAPDRTSHSADGGASSPAYPYNRYRAWRKRSHPDGSGTGNDSGDRIP